MDTDLGAYVYVRVQKGLRIYVTWSYFDEETV